MPAALQGLDQRLLMLGRDPAEDVAFLRGLLQVGLVAAFEVGPREQSQPLPEAGLAGEARHRLRIIARDYLEPDAVAAELRGRFGRIGPKLISYRDQAKRREAVRQL